MVNSYFQRAHVADNRDAMVDVEDEAVAADVEQQLDIVGDEVRDHVDLEEKDEEGRVGS